MSSLFVEKEPVNKLFETVNCAPVSSTQETLLIVTPLATVTVVLQSVAETTSPAAICVPFIIKL